MAGVQDGQVANQATFNNAFISRNGDSDTIGKLALKEASSAEILDVQKVINDDITALADHLTDIVDSHDASSISNVPSGNLVSTDIQGAVNELQSDIDTNASNIGTNTTNIGINASSIASINDANTGAPRMVAGLIQSANLPSYVDDVIEVANFAALPVTGETGKIYITIDDNVTYRWSGTVYIQLSGGGGLDQWISGAGYDATDIVWVAADNKIYRCITPNSDVTFTPANWQEISENPLEGTIDLSTSGNNVSVADNDGINILRAESEVLYIEDFKENDHSIFTDTANAVSSSNTTSTAIGKYRSMVVTVTTGVLGNGTLSPEVIVTDYMKEFGTVGLNSNTRFDGNLGDMVMYIEFFNGVDWTTLPTDSFNFRSGSNLNRFLIDLDDTCTKFRYTPRVVVAGSYVLEIGMIKLVSNPLPTAESVQSGSILHSAIGSTTTGTNPIQFNSANFSDENFERFATYSAGVWTAVADFKLGYTLSFVNSVASQWAALKVNGTTVNNENGVNAGAGNGYVNSSGGYPIKSGQTFEFFTQSEISATYVRNAVNLQLTATASSSNVVWQGVEDVGQYENDYIATADRTTVNGLVNLSENRLGYIQSLTRTGPGVYVGAYKAGFFSTSPKSLATQGSAVGDAVFASIRNESVTGFEAHLVNSTGIGVDEAFNIFTTRGSTDYITQVDRTYSVPVTNLVENVYSAKFNGRASFSDESASFVESRSFTGGVSTITWKAGHFTTAPNVIVSSANDNVNAIAYNITTTGCSVILNTTNSLTNIDVPFNMIVQRQGADYIAPKGYFLGNMAYGVGVAQTWQDVLASRARSIDYVNDTNAPIQVKVTATTMINGNVLRILVDGLIIDEEMTNSGNMIRHSVSAIVPKGSTYSIELTHGVSSLVRWHELR